MANSSRRCVIVCMLLQVGVLTGRSEDAFANINCPSPQYMVVGRTGRLDCSFPERFVAVYWKYEQGDEIYSLVGLVGTMKRGLGNKNGKYDIHSNGSLIIKEVGEEDEGVYSVMLVTSEDNVKHLRITLVATDDFADINCASPQYVVLGRTGRLNCSFPQKFTAVYWNYEHGDETSSLVGLEGAVKRGHGYENGTHDIHSDGSLIIEEVEEDDEGVYRVILVTSEDKVKHFRITLETTEYHSPFGEFYCETPQYLTLGRAGQIHCIFPETFNAVIWRQEINGRQYSLMAQENSVKKGQGFIDGRYDMHPHGSLIIHMVNATNDGIYEVTLVTAGDNIRHARVTLVTTVLSQQNHPYINLCGKDDHCSRRYDPGTPIYCSYKHSRPAVNLHWYIRYPSNDTLLQASFIYKEDSNKAFSSISRLNMTDLAAGSFVFLVCVAGGPPLTSHTIKSSLILDTSPKIYESSNDVNISKIDVPLYGHSVLPCGEIQPTLGAVMWLSVDLKGLTSTLVYSMYYEPYRRYYTYSTVNFNDNSTAIEFFRVTRENEQIYVCLSTDGTHTEVMATFQLAVYVTPTPPFIKVDACFDNAADCQLSSRAGNVTFCIYRVFNNVELATYVRDKSKISTNNETRSRQSIGDGYVNHCVTFDYELHQDVCEYPVSVFCYARTEGGLAIVPRREITFMNQEKCQSDIPSFRPVVTFSTWGVFAAVIVVLVIIIVCLCKEKRQPRANSTRVTPSIISVNGLRSKAHTEQSSYQAVRAEDTYTNNIRE